MTQLFYRRHYETLARVLGSAYRHTRSRAGEQTLDLAVRMLTRVFELDSKNFKPELFRRSILMYAHDEHDDDPNEGK